MPPVCCYLAVISLALAAASPAAAIAAPGSEAPAVPSSVQFLRAHNEARAAVGVPPLAWNGTVQLDAMQYATALRADCKARPLRAWATDAMYGRNIFMGTGRRSAAEVVAGWAGERRWYDPAANKCAPGKFCGSYTQVVWRATQQLGCALRRCRNGVDTMAVCEYYPPGNYDGERPY